jgi:Rrf2 family protein
MATNTQFSIAVHILAALGYRGGEHTTSANLAYSINASPSFVRRTLAKLSRAGLVQTATGKGGACRLARDPRQVTLLDVYRAVEAPKAFAIHTYNVRKPCPVSCHIKSALVHALSSTQQAMESTLAKISLAEVVADVKSA